MARVSAWLVALTVVGTVSAAPSSKYHIAVKMDKHADFQTLRTYAWTRGWASFDRTLDRRIVTAVDRELGALGLMKRDVGPSDVLVTYGSVQRTDVDVHKHHDELSGTYPEHGVGTLVVLMLESGTRRELFRARVDLPLDTPRTQLVGQVDTIVRKIFARYPTRVSSAQ
jgi:hypothetical protein